MISAPRIDIMAKADHLLSMDPCLDRVCAVVVARNRPKDVASLLYRISRQSRPLQDVVVVDNGDDNETPILCATSGVHYIRSMANLGGAGGFALGILLALARGADYIWLWDDDGYPESDDCLKKLLAFHRAGLAELVAPLVLDAANPSKSAYDYRVGGKYQRDRSAIQSEAVLDGQVHPFNGVLFSSSLVHKHGVPDVRLFIYGDEVDFIWRLQDAGDRIVTLTDATACHPASFHFVRPVLGGRLHALWPPDEARRWLLYRNHGYNLTRHGKPHLLVIEAVRYALFFLARRQPDFNGYCRWIAATWAGIRGRLGRPDAFGKAKND